MNSSLEIKLYRATARTFEDLGFMLPSADLNDQQRGAKCDATVEIAFRGEFSGRVVLTIGRTELATVAGNMLGADPAELAPETLDDALGELANVICGNLLPLVAGERATFALDAPRVLLESPRDDATGSVAVGLDDARAEIRFYIEGRLPGEMEKAA